MAAITTIKHRRGTSAAWTAANTTLSAGEFGFETDTGMMKIGDGATAWTSLGYAAVTVAQGDTRYVLASTLAVTTATLVSGKIPASQLPSLRLVSVSTVANAAARLALPPDDDAQFVVQSDTAVAYMLPAGSSPAVNGNWTALPQPSLTGVEMQTNKNAANGYAGLTAGGVIAAAQLGTIDGGTP